MDLQVLLLCARALAGLLSHVCVCVGRSVCRANTHVFGACVFAVLSGGQLERRNMDLPVGVSNDAAGLFLSTRRDADLVHMFQESGVPVAVQYRLGQAFSEVRKFASLADTRGELREALKADIGLEATGLESRAAVAGVVSAWEGARKYCEKADELKCWAKLACPTVCSRLAQARSVRDTKLSEVEQSLKSEPCKDAGTKAR